MSDSELWKLFCISINEGKISVILEGTNNTIDGGEIVTEVDDVIDHIKGI